MLDKKLASSYSASDPVFGPALERLLKRLAWLEEQQGAKGSPGKMLPSELLRVCQFVEIPMVPAASRSRRRMQHARAVPHPLAELLCAASG